MSRVGLLRRHLSLRPTILVSCTAVLLSGVAVPLHFQRTSRAGTLPTFSAGSRSSQGPPPPSARPPADNSPTYTPPCKQQKRSMWTFKPSPQRSQGDLVEHLLRTGVIRSPRVVSAMRAVDRKAFVAEDTAAMAYEDHPLPLGHGQTISAPHMHGIALELLEEQLQQGARVLDVGSGSGYLTACLAEMVGPQGWVLGVEKEPELARMGLTNLRRARPDLLDSGRVKVLHGNVLSDMLEGEEPFHAIHVGAAAEEIPEVLVDKLRPSGRMVIPVGPRFSHQVLMSVDKDAQGRLSAKEWMTVGYVPLTSPHEMDDGYMP